MEFNSVRGLASAIKDVIDASLSEDVAEVMKNTITRHIQTDVYDAYLPKVYQRRGYNGGLIDPNYLQVEVNNGQIVIVNVAHFNNAYPTIMSGSGLAELVEYGNNNGHGVYRYPYYEDFTRPRPFMKNSINEMKSTGSHISALEKGLNKRGIKIL